MESNRRYKVSAQDATTVTLVPQTGEVTKNDFADSIASIVITFTSARDDKWFDILNREFGITISRR